MIHSLRGDLLLSRADLVVHGVAPKDDLKNGLVLALRERFPAMYKDFRHHCHQNHPAPGELWLWQGVGPDGRTMRIAALFTQEPPAHKGGHAGRAHTEFVNHALRELRKLVDREGFRSVALPRIATGVGALEWEQVEPLVRAQLGELSIPILVYSDYEPGVVAEEPQG